MFNQLSWCGICKRFKEAFSSLNADSAPPTKSSDGVGVAQDAAVGGGAKEPPRGGAHDGRRLDGEGAT